MVISVQNTMERAGMCAVCSALFWRYLELQLWLSSTIRTDTKHLLLCSLACTGTYFSQLQVYSSGSCDYVADPGDPKFRRSVAMQASDDDSSGKSLVSGPDC